MTFVKNSRKGASRLGCLIYLLVLSAGVLLSWKMLPVYLDKIGFEEELLGIVTRAGAEAWGESSIRQHVILTAREAGFQLASSDIKIDQRRTNASRITVRVSYRRTVDFPGYVHTFEFQSEAEALVGRLK